MELEKATKKRIVIISVYFVIFVLFFWIIYSLTRPVETCSDGKKNQNEEETDCGGVCKKCKKITVKDMEVKKTGFTETGVNGEFDTYAIVKNVNNLHGAKSFNYTFIFRDDAGNSLSQKEGTNFILPGEEKYIVETDIASPGRPAKVDIEIKVNEWTEFEYYEKPQLKIIYKEYKSVSSGAGFSQAVGILKNESPFDFNIILIRVILKDSQGNIIGLNSTEMRTVKSGEEREFKSIWTSKFPGADYFTDMEIQAEVNVFDSEAFFEKYKSH
jgi:hypothetical protein